MIGTRPLGRRARTGLDERSHGSVAKRVAPVDQGLLFGLIDREGLPIVMRRDDGAGLHLLEREPESSPTKRKRSRLIQPWPGHSTIAPTRTLGRSARHADP